MHHPRIPRLLVAVFALGAPVLAHADTSATLATAINIPKGPASIEGFGRAYEAVSYTHLTLPTSDLV